MLQQVQLTRAEERLGAALHVELAVDVVDVLLDRTERDDEPVGDRLIGMALGDQVEDLTFTVTQWLDQRQGDRMTGRQGDGTIT